jgi:hypothetical protein
VKFGRPSKLTPVEQQQVRMRLAAGELQSVVAGIYRVSCSTISRLGHESAAASLSET